MTTSRTRTRTTETTTFSRAYTVPPPRLLICKTVTVKYMLGKTAGVARHDLPHLQIQRRGVHFDPPTNQMSWSTLSLGPTYKPNVMEYTWPHLNPNVM